MSRPEFDFARTRNAYPGFFVVHTLPDDNGYPAEFDQSPVVAWAFEVDSLVPYPVTLEGAQAHNVYILQPDGAVVRQNCRKFASVVEWLESQQANHMEKQGGPK